MTPSDMKYESGRAGERAKECAGSAGAARRPSLSLPRSTPITWAAGFVYKTLQALVLRPVFVARACMTGAALPAG